MLGVFPACSKISGSMCTVFSPDAYMVCDESLPSNLLSFLFFFCAFFSSFRCPFWMAWKSDPEIKSIYLSTGLKFPLHIIFSSVFYFVDYDCRIWRWDSLFSWIDLFLIISLKIHEQLLIWSICITDTRTIDVIFFSAERCLLATCSC